MSKVYCLLNHELTNNQILELKEKYDASNIIYPPKEVSVSWSQIPAIETLDMTTIKQVVSWLKGVCADDLFIIQGEFGSTFMLVDYALRRHMVPLHAVTKRIETEEVEGETVKRHYEFKHVCFRKYCYSDTLTGTQN